MSAQAVRDLAPALVRVRYEGRELLGLARDGLVHELDTTLDELLARPLTDIRAQLERSESRRVVKAFELLAPVASQEVWAAGVTYLRSREARVEESTVKDIYERVYEEDRPELFFKAAGWRVVGHGGAVGVRPDSTWDVPEPELAVLANSRGEIVAYACGNDMSSRSIEGANPLYLPQAKVYDRSCALGPAAVLAWHVDVTRAEIRLTIERDGHEVFTGRASTADMVRGVGELVAVLHSAYALPQGSWLLTGASVVPPESYTARAGDVVRISIAGLGELRNVVAVVQHTGARALPRLGRV